MTNKIVKVKLYHDGFGDKDKYIGEIPVEIKKHKLLKLKAPDDLVTILETVYANTQNIDDSWGKRYGLADCRSTSVGDYMIIEGSNTKWYVDRMGFTEDPVDEFGTKINKEAS
tara:strand:+ start:2228 stop:2566 length:339 start_codon:yes stop_codon:yes gene_type:complete